MVEIIYDGIPLEISNNIYFGKYKDESILSKFRQQCQANAPKNEGILIPAHLSVKLPSGLGPVKKTGQFRY